MKGKKPPGNLDYVCRIIDILYKTKSMETLSKRSFFVLAALFAFTTLRAQTADDIVNKYVAAIGGKDALSSVKSLTIQATSTIMGNDGPTTITIVVGQGYKSESEFGGSKIVTCVTPTGGWVLNPYMGAPTPTAMPDEQLKSAKVNMMLDPLANYAANGYKVELAGQDSVDYKVKMSGNGNDVIDYINMKTYLLDKVSTHYSMGGQEGDLTISFADYKKLDGGLMYPYTTTMSLQQGDLVIAASKVTVNSTVDPKIFDMPKQ
jgi:Ca2+-binding RTX toxin-like protein